MPRYRWGERSSNERATLHSVLQTVVDRALELSPFDLVIVHGYRNEQQQNRAYALGNTTKRWPDSLHNTFPTIAVDLAPWVNGEIPWDRPALFQIMTGCMFAAAKDLSVDLRWGGDWDSDWDLAEHRLQDLGHFELVGYDS